MTLYIQPLDKNASLCTQTYKIAFSQKYYHFISPKPFFLLVFGDLLQVYKNKPLNLS